MESLKNLPFLNNNHPRYTWNMKVGKWSRIRKWKRWGNRGSRKHLKSAHSNLELTINSLYTQSIISTTLISGGQRVQWFKRGSLKLQIIKQCQSYTWMYVMQEKMTRWKLLASAFFKEMMSRKKSNNSQTVSVSFNYLITVL